MKLINDDCLKAIYDPILEAMTDEIMELKNNLKFYQDKCSTGNPKE